MVGLRTQLETHGEPETPIASCIPVSGLQVGHNLGVWAEQLFRGSHMLREPIAPKERTPSGSLPIGKGALGWRWHG